MVREEIFYHSVKRKKSSSPYHDKIVILLVVDDLLSRLINLYFLLPTSYNVFLET